MMLGQETGGLVAQIFVCLTTLDTPLVLPIFVTRKRAGFLSYH